LVTPWKSTARRHLGFAVAGEYDGTRPTDHTPRDLDFPPAGKLAGPGVADDLKTIDNSDKSFHLLSQLG
jgi:hypothetical protein